MPFRSKKQQRFMYAARPKGVDLEEWARATDFSKLPEKVRKKRKKDKNDAESIADCLLRALKEKLKDKNDVFQGRESLESHGLPMTASIDQSLKLATEYQYQVKLSFSGADLGHLALDLAGLIPVIGEAADFSNAVWYISDGKYLLAALSLISMIPELGDAIGKGSKALAWLAKTAPDAAELIAKHGPEVADIIRMIRMVIRENRDLIDRAFQKLEEREEIKEHIPKVREALDAFSGNE